MPNVFQRRTKRDYFIKTGYSEKQMYIRDEKKK